MDISIETDYCNFIFNELSSRIYRMTKGIIIDYFTYLKIKNTSLKESEKKIKQLVEIWVERLNGKPFHGGDSPDAGDFRVIIFHL